MGGCCANSHPAQGDIRISNLPWIMVTVNGKQVSALVDTGCTTSIVHSGISGSCYGRSRVISFDGNPVDCLGKSRVELTVAGKTIVSEVLVVDNIVGNFKVVLGMDIILELGGVVVRKEGVTFDQQICAAVVRACPNVIVDKDFSATFDGKVWTVEWNWIGDQAPVLKNKVESYSGKMSSDKEAAYEKEIDRWIDEGILLEWHEKVDEGLLPLMAVEQEIKSKVRPVFDYREMNQYVSCHTGDEFIDVCAEKLREWRKVQGKAEIVDLKCAYMQIRVSKELWKYQLVRYKGKVFCLTRLGFGLNCAPRIMAKILKTVLGSSEQIENGTSSYIDDILVDTGKVSSESVVHHLSQHGLESKPPEPLEEGSALGLKLHVDKGVLVFGRGNEIPLVDKRLTRRELFSLCGKLVGHYPVAGWLRISCSYVKRRAEGHRWEDYIGDTAWAMVCDILARVQSEDPVSGVWHVPNSNRGRVWCDASDLALGVIIEVEGVVVEDATWLRKKDDYNHINVAELEGVLKGLIWL